MSGRSLYIEEHENDACPVTGCGCEANHTVADLLPVTDGALSAGDPSPAGRCPECDGFAYLDRPKDRARTALNHLLWTLEKGYPPGDANLMKACADFAATLSDAPGGLTATLTIS